MSKTFGIVFEVDPSGAKAGTEALIQQLSSTYAKIRENKAEMKELAAQIKSLENQQKSLAKAMKDGGTEEQKKQMDALNAEYTEANKKLDTLKATEMSLKNELSLTNKELKERQSGLSDASQGISELSATTVAKGQLIADALKSAYNELKNIVESTREYRSDLSKLEINADTSNVNFDAVKAQLKELNAITGETDSNIEALSNLLAAGFTENQLGDVVSALSGAVLKFPDTLKIESLSDSLQETIATGAATGQFAELLDRLGVSADTFSAGLEKAKTAGTEYSYVMQSLANTGLAQVNEQWRTDNDTIIAQADAQFDLNESLAQLAETAEPLMTTITQITANILENKQAVITLTSAVVAGKVAYEGGKFIDMARTSFATLKPAVEAATAAQAANNAVVAVNPYVLVASAIAAVVAALAAFAISADSTTQKVEELNAATEALNKQHQEQVSSSEAELSLLERQGKRYEELRQQISLTAQEKAELKSLAAQLQETLGDGVTVINKQTGAYQSLSEEIGNYIKNARLALELKIGEENATQSLKNIEALKAAMAEEVENADALMARMSAKGYKSIAEAYGVTIDTSSIDAIKKSYESLSGYFYNLKDFGDPFYDYMSNIRYYLLEIENEETNVADYFSKSAEAAMGAGEKYNDTNDDLKDLADTAQTAAEALQELQVAVSLVSSAMSEQGKNGQISLSTYIKLKEAGYEAALSVDNLTGTFQLNIDKMKDVAKNYYETKIAAENLTLANYELARSTLIAAGINSATDAQKWSDLTGDINKKREEIEIYLALLKQLNEGTGEFSSGGSGSGGSSGTGKTAFELALADLKYNLDMEYITQKQYYDRLEALNEQHNKNNLELYRQYEVEVKKGRDKLLDETVSANEKQLDSMLKSYNSYLDSLKQARKNAQEDEDLQSQINAVDTRLEYEQMDDFSRYELEKKRKELVKQQEDVAFDRMIEAKKTEAETLVTDLKGRIDLTSQQTTAALASVNAMLENMARYSQNITNNTNKTINNYSNSFALTNPYYSLEQIANYVVKKIGG